MQPHHQIPWAPTRTCIGARRWGRGEVFGSIQCGSRHFAVRAYSHPNFQTRDDRPTACSLPITMANFAMPHTTPPQDRRAACVVYRNGGCASSGSTGAGPLLSRLRVLQGHAARSTVVVVRCGRLRAVVWLGRVGAHGRCEGGGGTTRGFTPTALYFTPPPQYRQRTIPGPPIHRGSKSRVKWQRRAS